MLLRSPFFWKLYGGYVALVVLSVTIVGVLAGRLLTRETLAETEGTLEVRAALMRTIALPALRGAEADALQAEVRALGEATGTRLTVIRADGRVVADSDEDPATMDDHGARPEVLAARGAGTGTATRFSRTVAANMMYLAQAVVDGDGTLLGYVRVAVPLVRVARRLSDLRRSLVTGGLAAVLVALGVGGVAAGRITAPLRSMATAAQAIAGGDYRHTVASHSLDEIGRLATSFNRMTAALRGRMEAIGEEHAKLLTILGGMVEGVVAVDTDQRVVHLNAAAGRILGVQPAAVLGVPVWEVTRVRKVVEAVAAALESAQEVTDEVQVMLEGEDRNVELHGAPLRNAAGGLVGAVLVVHDVTELRRLETVRQDFVANVSHELKTPITAIRGLVDTIVDDGVMPDDTRDRFLRKIQNQSVRLALLVTDLLTLARLESAQGLLEVGDLDLRETLRASERQYRAEAESRGVAVVVEAPEEPVRTEGDAEALALLVNNLLDNALKYTPEGGRVALRLRRDGDWGVLEVQDTGIGIAREHHDRVFERFYRVDKARSRELGGTGLGLSIVKHVCKAHGGRVSLESAPGKGSTFRVFLPLTAVGV